ncbi:RNA-directed DNA polymerase, eukaryota [Tanacetum coccineum]
MAIMRCMRLEPSRSMTVDEFKAWLCAYDDNHDGRISQEELKEALHGLRIWFGRWKAKTAMKSVDSNRSGTIDSPTEMEKLWLGSEHTQSHGRNVDKVKKRVGNGCNTRFWLDIWVLDCPLSIRFPRIFALEIDKEVSVSVKMGANSIVDSFRRPIVLWSCDVNGDGMFRVKDIRSSLDDIFLPSSALATRWVKYIPIKINIFIWRARLDRLPTRSNLANRGVVLDSLLCPICGSVPEDASHFLFQCGLSKLVFRKICRWWDLVPNDMSSFSDWDVWFSGIRLPCKLKLILEGVFYVAWWHIWRFRNQSIFAETPPRRSVLFDDIVSRAFDCTRRQKPESQTSQWFKIGILQSLQARTSLQTFEVVSQEKKAWAFDYTN